LDIHRICFQVPLDNHRVCFQVSLDNHRVFSSFFGYS
jgi:hypothetical protein